MDNLNERLNNKQINKKKFTNNFLIGLILFLLVFYYIFTHPVGQSRDVTIHISSEDSLSTISDKLEKENVIRSSFSLKTFLSLFSADKEIPTGDYLFEKGKNLFGVSWQLYKGNHNVEPIRITLKEGYTREDMAKVLADKIPNFRKDIFMSSEKSLEGYMFPDTYFFFPLSTTEEIIDEISLNFKNRISSLDKDIKESGKSLSDVIKMASILEKEANGKEDAPVISGILWKRIELGMLLQVDAAPETYKEGGLPDVPISNPGLSSIRAAISPKKSNYLFYLHEDGGQVHYATNFSEHRSNIAKYLK